MSSHTLSRPSRPPALSSTPTAPRAAPIVDSTSSSDRITARVPSGGSVVVLLHGATVISWKDDEGKERLWLSEGAVLDGSKAVRGGVPVVFPVFGLSPDHPATAPLPQHGFARTTRWEFLGSTNTESDNDTAVTMDFGLSTASVPEAAYKKWGGGKYDFGLIYSVTLGKGGVLSTKMMIRNEGGEAWEFQVLLHTYLRVDDITKTTLTGLSNTTYIDKVGASAPSQKSESNKSISFTGETDRVYSTPGAAEQPLTVSVGSKPVFELVRDNLDDAVVWNPWIEKSKGMADFAPKDGWKNMLCVEAGAVSKWVRLEAGETYEGGVVIRSLL